MRHNREEASGFCDWDVLPYLACYSVNLPGCSCGNEPRREAIRARRGWESRETDAGLVSLVDVNGINEAYAADRSGHH
jgi:hypothetical protein